MNHPRSEATPRLEVLAETARRWADQPSPAPSISRWPSLQRALAGGRRRPSRPTLWIVSLATAMTIAIAVVAVARWRLGLTSTTRTAEMGAGAIVFSFAGGPRTEGETLQAGAGAGQAQFSDGSSVSLRDGARVRVLSTTRFGAHVRLDTGRAHFAVAHHPRVDWAVEAGPFAVIVHGTTFEVDWSPGDGTFSVALLTGRVSITGPLSGGNDVTLEAGRRFTARMDGTYRISRLDEPPAGNGVPGLQKQPTEQPAVQPEAERLPGPAVTPSRAHPLRHGDRAALSAAAATWAPRVAAGQFESVIDEVESLGTERCVDEVSARSLEALADAARYGRRTDLAKKALLAQRRRFSHSAESHDAAFLLGRLAEDAEHDLSGALAWYERYLKDHGRPGSYGSEALGREMLVLDRLGQHARATQAARLYLETFPSGPYASQAARHAD